MSSASTGSSSWPTLISFRIVYQLFGTSLCVRTCTTPLTCSARATCRRSIRSRGGARSGASSGAACPGGLTSSKNCVRPVTWPSASERWTGLPMTLKPSRPAMVVDRLHRRFAARRRARVEDRASMIALVARAAADVAGDRAHDVLAGRGRVLGQQRLGGHDHARRAEAALGGEAVEEGLLERRERPSAGVMPSSVLTRRAVDRSRPGPGRTSRRRRRAGTVQVPQVPCAAAALGRGQAERVAQRAQQRGAGLGEELAALAVDVRAR